MSAALTAYRALIRSARLAFHEDSQVLTAALASTRAGFEENRFATATEAEAQIKHAHEVATFLRQNLVQGKLDEESGKYKLRIHDEIERGDNDTIKLNKTNRPTTNLAGGTKCCSS